MQKTWVSRLFIGAAALVLSVAQARADVIADWGFNTTAKPIYNNVGGANTSSIEFTSVTGFAGKKAGFVIFTMETKSSALESSPDAFVQVPMDLDVTLIDIATANSKTLKFTGLYSAEEVSKTSFFGAKDEWPLGKKQSITLGSDDKGWREYTVEIKSFTSSGVPSKSQGSIYAEILIAEGTKPPTEGGGGDPEPTPEPASLVLAGLGLPLFGVMYRRRRKSEDAAQ